MPEINQLLPKEGLEGLSRRERKKQETRWRIFDAAMLLFTRHDYDSVKIEEICEQADVSSAAFFQHFANKGALIRAYIENLKADIGQKLDLITDSSYTMKLELISKEVKGSGAKTASFGASVFAAVTQGEAALDMEHIDTGITGTLTDIIRAGQECGEFNPEWKAEVIAASLVGSWLILPLASKSPDFPPAPHEELMRLILAGLKR